MNTENIQKFLSTEYSDEKLTALLAHAQDGKLGYYSCCCLIGTATADHALRTPDETVRAVIANQFTEHLIKARELPNAVAAEREFEMLGDNDFQRRERLIPLILAEMERREERHEADPRDEEGSDVKVEIEVYRGR